MDTIFLKLFNMSICAGWLILAVIVLRLLLRRAPKWMRCVLWAFVAVRLICPFSVKTIFSLIPSAETVSPEDVRYSARPEIHSGVSAIDNSLNPIIREAFTPDPAASANPLGILATAAGVLWLLGLTAMLGYALSSYIRLRQNVSESIRLQHGIALCDNVSSPFILGLIRPVIYLPSGLDENAIRYVLAHERAHLMRRDHWWKALGFCLLAVYWFHPLVWVAYTLLCRDIELACDEKVVKNWDLAKKKAYSHALVSCSTQQNVRLYCPLAFGEVGVRARVKAVLSYKKPAFRVIAASASACVLVAICFLTNPVGQAKNVSKSGGTNPQTTPVKDQSALTDEPDEDAQTALADEPDEDWPTLTDEPGEDAQTVHTDEPDEDQSTLTDEPDEDAQTALTDKPDEDQPAYTDEPDEDAQTVHTGYPLYDSLILAVTRVLEHPQAEEYAYERTLFTSAYFYSDMTWQTPGYLLMDLDGNGVDELLFGENHDDDWNGIVFDIYTISDGNLLHVAEGWERNRYYLCENGCVANEGSGGAAESTYCYYTYEGTSLTLVESVVYDASLDPANPWFYTTEDPDARTAGMTPISERRAHEIMDKYVYVLPQFTPFS